MKPRVLAALVLLAVLSCAPRADATITVHYNAIPTVVFNGDSITSPLYAWMSTQGGYVDQVNAQITAALPATAASTGRNSGQQASASGNLGSAKPSSGIAVVNSGISGNKIADLQTSVASRVTAFTPGIVVTEIGINDATAGTSPSTFRASYDAYLAAVTSGTPGAQLMCISINYDGEQWTATPSLAWNNGGIDATIDALNAQISASCAAAGGTYVNTRASFLTLEQANNTPAPGAAFGVYAISGGVHPTPAGKVAMGNSAMAATTVAP